MIPCQVCTVYEAMITRDLGKLRLRVCDSCLARLRTTLKQAVKQRAGELADLRREREEQGWRVPRDQ